MTYEHTGPERGSYGAKRQSWGNVNPRDLLKRIVAKTSSEREAYDAFMEALGDEIGMPITGILKPIVEYWFANNYRSMAIPATPAQTAAQKKRAAAAAQKAAELEAKKKKAAAEKADKYKAQAKDAFAKFALLQMVMPNGKTLAECTGKETIQFGGKFIAVGKGVKLNEKVGKLSEAAAWKLFR